jgi:hypothetical protein
MPCIAPDFGVQKPVHEFGATNAERIFQTLIRTGGEAVNGDCEAGNADFRHAISTVEYLDGF